jgi:hypothetical protein
MTKIPRLVAFHNKKAICAGCPASLHPETKVLPLPSDGPDFISVNVAGMTEDEILQLGDVLPNEHQATV